MIPEGISHNSLVLLESNNNIIFNYKQDTGRGLHVIHIAGEASVRRISALSGNLNLRSDKNRLF